MPTIAATGPGRFTRVVMQALLERTDVVRVDGGRPGRESQHVHAHGESGDADNRERGDGQAGDGDEPLGRVVILPTNFVFPLPNSLISASAEQREEMRSTLLAAESLAVHHWAGSWLKQHLGLPAWSAPPGLPRASAAACLHCVRVATCARLLLRLRLILLWDPCPCVAGAPAPTRPPPAPSTLGLSSAGSEEASEL